MNVLQHTDIECWSRCWDAFHTYILHVYKYTSCIHLTFTGGRKMDGSRFPSLGFPLIENIEPFNVADGNVEC